MKAIFEHHLLCVSCHFKFAIESEESNNTRIGVDKMSCPLCKSVIQIDPAFLGVSVKPSTKAQSRWNIEASQAALEMAAEHKRKDAEAGINQETLVTSSQRGSEGKIIKIPKKVIDSIKEKISPVLKE